MVALGKYKVVVGEMALKGKHWWRRCNKIMEENDDAYKGELWSENRNKT